MDWIKVASAQELSNDEAKTVDVAGYGVALYRIDDEFSPQTACAPMPPPCCRRVTWKTVVSIPPASGRFDIRTGKAMCAPVTVDLRTHAVERRAITSTCCRLPANDLHAASSSSVRASRRLSRHTPCASMATADASRCWGASATDRTSARPCPRPSRSAADALRLDVLTDESWARSKIDLLSGSDAVALDLRSSTSALRTGRYSGTSSACSPPAARRSRSASVPAGRRWCTTSGLWMTRAGCAAALQGTPQVAILGGGFLGLEIAHSALSAGASVTVLERATALLDRFAPPQASVWLEREVQRRAPRSCSALPAAASIHCRPVGCA